jgi:hypothetical protein
VTGKRIAKADLPTKTCAVCQLPFAWRKKWSKVWDEVRYCSDACRGRRHTARQSSSEPLDSK